MKTLSGVRVNTQVFAVQRLTPRLLTRTVASEASKHHDAFLEILASRDSEQARTWMAAHIRIGRDTVLGHMISEAGSDSAAN